jgi:phosphoribosylformylglycinamidine (FGAM) synthase-like enzyme
MLLIARAFSVVVDKSDGDGVIDSFEKNGVEIEQIGKVTDSRKIIVLYKREKIELVNF